MSSLSIPLLIGLFALRLGAESPSTAQGFNHFYNLEYDQALADFDQSA